MLSGRSIEAWICFRKKRILNRFTAATVDQENIQAHLSNQQVDGKNGSYDSKPRLHRIVKQQNGGNVYSLSASREMTNF